MSFPSFLVVWVLLEKAGVKAGGIGLLTRVVNNRIGMRLNSRPDLMRPRWGSVACAVARAESSNCGVQQ